MHTGLAETPQSKTAKLFKILSKITNIAFATYIATELATLILRKWLPEVRAIWKARPHYDDIFLVSLIYLCIYGPFFLIISGLLLLSERLIVPLAGKLVDHVDKFLNKNLPGLKSTFTKGLAAVTSLFLVVAFLKPINTHVVGNIKRMVHSRGLIYKSLAIVRDVSFIIAANGLGFIILFPLALMFFATIGSIMNKNSINELMSVNTKSSESPKIVPRTTFSAVPVEQSVDTINPVVGSKFVKLFVPEFAQVKQATFGALATLRGIASRAATTLTAAERTPAFRAAP